jgi:DNA invertase Pin-like site-specific DNA recombinase
MGTEEKLEKPIIKCAIYTRKSTTDGLEQDFTTLDVQREACENFIASQKNEGWVALPEKYDDGGYTGANTDRPALQRLIADIKENKINCIVIYKVDRLSRSLLDFAGLLSLFEKHNVSFVSITQNFNSSTSMGRLTLNILLSFAQFEREIISERTRDKMAAAKKKGRWIGGRPPLGYDIDREKHKLYINPKEADMVREIFNLYLEKRSVMTVSSILNDKGYMTKSFTTPAGRKFGGKQFKGTSIGIILNNIIYTGKVTYKGEIYQGKQEPIISEETFYKAQKLLAEQKPEWSMTKKNKHVGLLHGILHCKYCNCIMYYAYNLKSNKYKYHYYLCMNAQKRGHKNCPVKMVCAQKIEDKVIGLLRTLVSVPKLEENVWAVLNTDERVALTRSILKTANYDGVNQKLELILHNDDKMHEFNVELRELKNLPVPPNEVGIKKEPQLRQNLILAHQVRGIIDKGEAKSIKQVAEWLNMDHQRLNQITNFLLLAPQIQEEILCSESEILYAIPEYKLRDVAFELDWQKQLLMWQELRNNPTK